MTKPKARGAVSEQFMRHYYGAERGEPDPKVIVPINPSDARLRAGVKAFQHARAGNDNLDDWRAFWNAAVLFRDD